MTACSPSPRIAADSLRTNVEVPVRVRLRQADELALGLVYPCRCDGMTTSQRVLVGNVEAEVGRAEGIAFRDVRAIGALFQLLARLGLGREERRCRE